MYAIKVLNQKIKTIEKCIDKWERYQEAGLLKRSSYWKLQIMKQKRLIKSLNKSIETLTK